MVDPGKKMLVDPVGSHWWIRKMAPDRFQLLILVDSGVGS